MTDHWELVTDQSPISWEEWTLVELHFAVLPGKDETCGHATVVLRRQGTGSPKLRLSCFNARIEATRETGEVGTLVRDNRSAQLELPPPFEVVAVYDDDKIGRTLISCTDVVWERSKA